MPIRCEIVFVHLKIREKIVNENFCDQTYFFNGLLGFLDLAKLDVAIPKESVVRADRDLAAQDFSETTKLGVQIGMTPLHLFKTFDENGSALDVFATWLSADGVHVVRESSTHFVGLDDWEAMLLNGSLGILDGVKHHERVIKVLEQRSIKNDD